MVKRVGVTVLLVAGIATGSLWLLRDRRAAKTALWQPSQETSTYRELDEFEMAIGGGDFVDPGTATIH